MIDELIVGQTYKLASGHEGHKTGFYLFLKMLLDF